MTRNPKDLRGMVEGNHKGADQKVFQIDDNHEFGEQGVVTSSSMETNLAKLRGLSAEDKTENAMLRSRITDQSQLIMILKQRADEAIVAAKSLEIINKELVDFRENAEDELNSQLRKFNILDDRFMDLASNHEEMIRFKDEYKNRNKELMKENAQLRSDNSRLFSKALQDRNEVIADLESKIHEIMNECSVMENKYKNVLDATQKNEEKSQTEIDDLKRRIKESEESLKESDRRLQQQLTSQQNFDQSSQMKLMTLTKEKDDLLELAMSRGKIIQEKQAENKKLQRKIFDMEKSVQNMQQKFERDAALVDVNLQVRRLKMELSEVNSMYDDAVQEFRAYRTHSSTLLEREKDLNSRLRHLYE